jgi:hypothetical protein
MRLYVGGQAWSVQGERDDLAGERCWSAAYPCQALPADPAAVCCLLDSGAFTDSPSARLTPALALDRQLRWETLARVAWGVPSWQVEALVSYDCLIDESWVAGRKVKRRWSLAEAERAVRVTVESAAYLASRRRLLSPRSLVLACQGVECEQYAECARAVLRYARPGDWLGLGGWCLLGRAKTLLAEFQRTCRLVLPLAVDAGIRRAHLFGVLWEPALASLLWLCDQLGLEASCDSAAPVLACTRGNPRKAGVRAPGWRANVAWWQRRLANLRSLPSYRAPVRELWV